MKIVKKLKIDLKEIKLKTDKNSNSPVRKIEGKKPEERKLDEKLKKVEIKKERLLEFGGDKGNNKEDKENVFEDKQKFQNGISTPDVKAQEFPSVSARKQNLEDSAEKTPETTTRETTAEENSQPREVYSGAYSARRNNAQYSGSRQARDNRTLMDEARRAGAVIDIKPIAGTGQEARVGREVRFHNPLARGQNQQSQQDYYSTMEHPDVVSTTRFENPFKTEVKGRRDIREDYDVV